MYKANVIRESQDQIWVFNDPLYLFHPVTQTSKFPRSCLGWWLWSCKGCRGSFGTSHPSTLMMAMAWGILCSLRRQPSQVICIPSFHCDYFFYYPQRRLCLKLYEGEENVFLSHRKAALVLHVLKWLLLKLRSAFRMTLQDMNRYLNAFWKPCHGTLTVTVLIPQRAFFPCLSGTFECCS